MINIGAMKEKLRVFSKEELIAELIGALLGATAMAEALRPFAAVAGADISSEEDDGDLWTPIRNNRAPQITVGHMRKAARALEEPKP